MATDTLVRPTAEEDMTEDQMQSMLAEAAARLQQNQIATVPEEDADKYHFPRLETGAITQSYVTHKDGVAHLDPARRLGENDRKLSNKIRKVEDPVVVSKRKAEVRTHHAFLYAYEENFPKFPS